MDTKEIAGRIRQLDGWYLEQAQKRLDNLTKPLGSLGRLEELARQLVAVYRDPMPELPRKVVFTFAGDHGVTAEGVSAYPAEVTPQMVENIMRGGAGINALARLAGARDAADRRTGRRVLHRQRRAGRSGAPTRARCAPRRASSASRCAIPARTQKNAKIFCGSKRAPRGRAPRTSSRRRGPGRRRGSRTS